MAAQEVAGGVRLGFVHVGQDLEEQPELVECLLAFFLHLLLADDAIACLLPGRAPVCVAPHLLRMPEDASFSSRFSSQADKVFSPCVQLLNILCRQ